MVEIPIWLAVLLVALASVGAVAVVFSALCLEDAGMWDTDER